MSAFMVVARGYNMYDRIPPSVILDSRYALYVPKPRLFYALENRPKSRASRYISINMQAVANAYPTLDVLLAADASVSHSQYGAWDCALRSARRDAYIDLGIPVDYLGTEYVRAILANPAACCKALSSCGSLRLADVHKLCAGGISRANSRVSREYYHKFTVEFFIACKFRSPNMWSLAGEAAAVGNTDLVVYALEKCARIPSYGYPAMNAMTAYLLSAAGVEHVEKLIIKSCCKKMPPLEVLRGLPISASAAREIIKVDTHLFYTLESEYLHSLARG